LAVDLNPIENIWSIVQRKVAQRTPPPLNEADLYAAWRAEWDALPTQMVNNLVESFTERLRKVIATKGASVVGA
jgi:hypothetical protein